MIFVDDLFSWPPSLPYRSHQAIAVAARHGHRWCHMTSDEETVATPELDAFARRLGLRVGYRHGGHYDLVPPLRERAIELGARPLTRRQWVALRRAKFSRPALPPHNDLFRMEGAPGHVMCARCRILEELLAATR